jgi:hypothetical protein
MYVFQIRRAGRRQLISLAVMSSQRWLDLFCHQRWQFQLGLYFLKQEGHKE